jgi:hypothetical protein
VAELVDALDSKSSAFGRAGSIPARGTKRDKFKILELVPFSFFDDSLSNNTLFLKITRS